MVQNDDFFNVDIQYIRDEYNEVELVPFYESWFQRFIDDDDIDLDDLAFLDEDLWETVHQD
jgi:hypothetical protein